MDTKRHTSDFATIGIIMEVGYLALDHLAVDSGPHLPSGVSDYFLK